MPEYKCECCDFKTMDKGKFFRHNETNKHLKKMELFVKQDPEPESPQIEKNEEIDFKKKIVNLENTIELLIKRIEVLEKNQVVKEDTTRVADLVIEQVDINEIINHIEYETHIDLEPYTKHTNCGDTIQWDDYVKEQIDEDTRIEIKNHKVPFKLLKDTYEESSEKAIFKKLCVLIPKDTIKVNDLSRGKYSIYCQGKWLNSVEATEILEKMINLLQKNISNLHSIYISCEELYREIDCDNFLKMNERVHEGNAIKKSIIKNMLEYYKD
jgi:hypothetical protein